MNGLHSSNIRRCRECGAELIKPARFLCGVCRVKVKAQQNEARRIRERARYYQNKNVKKKKTADAENPNSNVLGSAYYENEHSYKGYMDPMPPGPPTSMAWIHGFDDWAKSGLSYGDYQVAERSGH